jgi:uncharacterized protein
MDLAKHWRQRAQRYRLEGQRNTETGAVRFPPEADGDQAWAPHQLAGVGSIWSWSVVRQAPAGFEGQAPYLVALVQLAEGPLVSAQLTDCTPEDLTIGQAVEMVTRKINDLGPDGLIVYGYKFRPRLE